MGFNEYMAGEGSIEYVRLSPQGNSDGITSDWQRILEPNIFVRASRPIELRDNHLPLSIKRGLYERLKRKNEDK